ncbi:SctK family type III secretion system sorting platform protein [Bordetella tumulicola]|uniref:SctK family type III secretion system sorting platform protein n=1 Tax=Bordetella tumulicola TaxID=1649133 RepID=UPI0039F0FF46
MLEFNFLPSRTLHPSRHAAFATLDLTPSTSMTRDWQRIWHKHWSRHILRRLDLGMVYETHHPELALGLLPVASLTTLARRVGAVLCGPSLRQTILGPRVRALRASLGSDLLRFVQHDTVPCGAHEYDGGAALMHERDMLKVLESLGYGCLLRCVSGAPAQVMRRIELKLPSDVRESDSPLTAEAAWELCLAVLKKMDATWCSFFHEIR